MRSPSFEVVIILPENVLISSALSPWSGPKGMRHPLFGMCFGDISTYF